MHVQSTKALGLMPSNWRCGINPKNQEHAQVFVPVPDADLNGILTQDRPANAGSVSWHFDA